MSGGGAGLFSRRAVLASAGGGALVGLSGCGGTGRRAGEGGTLVVALDPEPMSLAAAGSIDAGASVVSVKIFDRLFNTDLAGNPVPMLAQNAQVEDGGRAVTLNLRPGLAWHDGKPLTADDVAFSIEQVWKLRNPRSQLAFSGLQSIAVERADRLTLHFDKPAPYIFSALADGMAQVVPRHLYAGRDVVTNPVNQAPVGSGPWLFEAWERGDFLSLRRNPHYWDRGKPYLDRLVFRFIPAGAPSVAALESGAVDHLANGVPLGEADRLAGSRGFWVRSQAAEVTPSFAGFGFNMNRPVLRDPRIRHAVAHAIDREFILKNIWLGHGTLADSPIPPASPWHAEGLPRYAFDPGKAEQLLDAAGLRRGAGGVRLTLRNDIMPPSTLHPRVAQFIRQGLARVGIDLQLRQEGLPAYLRRIFTTRDWDTVTYSTGSDADPAIGIQRFYASGSIQIGVPYSNPTHYATPQLDALFESAKTEPDKVRRKALYDQAQQTIQQDLPLIPILFPRAVEAGARRVEIPDGLRIRNFADARVVEG